ncbi:MAG: hypothetical protein JNL01_13960 [Bdellovibrionales bacterium]|nr:hypothetical protein [Bdellovibrionales bacterium]
MMNRTILTLVLAGSIGTLAGCAHGGPALGTLALKHSDTEADVYLHTEDLKKGDKLAFFQNECRSRESARGTRNVCNKVKVGSGEVVQVLNEHYSTVRLPASVQLGEGTLVEKE